MGHEQGVLGLKVSKNDIYGTVIYRREPTAIFSAGPYPLRARHPRWGEDGRFVSQQGVMQSGQRRTPVYSSLIDVCSATARALIALRELCSQRSIAINRVPPVWTRSSSIRRSSSISSPGLEVVFLST